MKGVLSHLGRGMRPLRSLPLTSALHRGARNPGIPVTGGHLFLERTEREETEAAVP